MCACGWEGSRSILRLNLSFRTRPATIHWEDLVWQGGTHASSRLNPTLCLDFALTDRDRCCASIRRRSGSLAEHAVLDAGGDALSGCELRPGDHHQSRTRRRGWKEFLPRLSV